MSFRRLSGVLAIVVCSCLVAAALGAGLQNDQPQDASAVTVFIVRHAEKLEGRDPDLSAEGQHRANRLRDMLADQQLDAVYVTRTKRSLQTGSPAAEMAGVVPTEYPPTGMDELVGMIDEIDAGGSVLVVAHSNTLPMVLRALGGPEIPELDESVYDRFIAVVRDGGKHIKTIELRF